LLKIKYLFSGASGAGNSANLTRQIITGNYPDSTGNVAIEVV
jgi:hypothetical protein